MTFHVGQKVVCVDASDMDTYFSDVSCPVEGGIYTVRNFRETGESAIRLVEIVNPKHPWMDGFNECGFRPSRFRPIVERKTDISIFTSMLNPSKRSVDA